jgi:tetratricopeptide (TPR) repeat protein
MTIRAFPIRKLGLTIVGVGLLATATAFLLRSRLRITSSLDDLQPLLAARRFDDAERRINIYLKEHPDSDRAHLLMAQVCLARGVQKPRLALDHLARIRTGHRGLKAMILLNEGKAYSALGQNDRAEYAWKEALRIEPGAPEVGWDLLGLYNVQGRREDARRLGLTLHAVEPDPRDRAQLLLELIRQDAQPIDLDSLIATLEPLVRAHSEDLHTALALGQALVRNSRLDEGLAILRARVERFADDPDAWNALIRGLDDAGRFEELTGALDRLPPQLAKDPRFDGYRGSALQSRQDWPRAADAYLRAWRADPSDFQVLYRLSRALKAAGRGRDAEAFELRVRGAQEVKDQVLPLYEEANAVKDLGVAPHPDLYHRLAGLREQMGRYDEAVAWHRMVLEYQPDDKQSKEAIARLNNAKAEITASQ